MKRFLALAALVLGLAACQTEPEGLDVIVGGEVETTVCVSLPETTRANSAVGALENQVLNGNYSLRYILEVYLGENCQRHVLVSDNTSVAFPVRLAPGRDYQLVVWADIVEGDSQADRYYNTDPENGGLKAVSIVESTWNAMDETRDAFTATQTVSAQDIASGAITMTLERPFAKLRVVATDYDDVVKLGLAPASAVVTYSQEMPRTYNALNATPVFTSASSKSHTITYPADTNDAVYSYEDGEYTLFADYFFVPETGTAKFEFDVKTATDSRIKYTNFNTEIFVEANKLTTIKGDVLTTGANINIDIEDNGAMDTPSYEYKAIGNATAFYEALNNGGEYIVTSDLVIDQAYVPSAQRTATRTTGATAEGKVTTINLNGKTITVTNKTGEPFATVAAGNILLLEGGNIVLTEDSTASFIKNDGNVVLTSGEIKSNSSSVAVINGDIVVDGGEVLDDKATIVTSKQWLEDVLANGGTYIFTDDMTAGDIIEVTATNPVVINGNGKTISFTSNRGFRITASNNVTIENATIVNNVNGGRCIETRTGGINLTLNNVELTATNGASQPFTVGGSGNGITVNINNSTLTSGNGGYGITTFNPVALNINNSTVSGYAALNIKEASSSLGSAGSVINVVGSILNGVNNVTANESNSFSTIMIEDNNIEINVDSTSTVKATTSNGNGQCIVGFGNETVTSLISGCELTFVGEIVLEGEQTSYVGCSSYQGGLYGNIVKFADEYAETLEAEGWIVGEPTDGLVTIAEEVAQIGEEKYTSLEAAVAAAQTDDTVMFIANVEQADGVVITDKNITIDLNGKTFTVTNGANTNNRNFKVNGSSVVTIKNGTMVAAGEYSSGAYGTVRTEGTANVTLEDVELYNYRGNGLNVKVCTGTTVTINNSEIYSQYGGGVEAAGGTVVLNDVTINQNGVYYVNAWNSAAIGVNGNGKVTVNSGNYSASAISTDANAAQGTWVAFVMTSGGTLDIQGGTFNGVVAETAAAANACGLICADTKAVVEIHGGTFNSNGAILDMRNNTGGQNPKATLFGGTFSADPRISGLYGSNLIIVAEGKVAAQGADGRWTLVDGVMDEAGLKAAFEKGGNIVLGADITVSETVTLAEGKTAALNLNGKTLAHAEMATQYAINNLGTLTITGNGTVNSRGIYNGYGYGAENVADANLTIINGTFNAKGENGGAAVFNYGIVDVKGGKFTSIGGYSLNNQSGASMTIAEGVTANNGVYTTGATLTINGGEISGNRSGCHVIYGWNANITINGGTFYNNNSSNATVMAVGTTTITYNGGTYGIKDGRVPGNGNTWTSCLLDSANSATAVINGGTYNGGFRVQAGSSMTINSGSFNDCYGSAYNIIGTVTVKGGTYTDDTAKKFANKYIAEGYEMNANGEVVAK